MVGKSFASDVKLMITKRSNHIPIFTNIESTKVTHRFLLIDLNQYACGESTYKTSSLNMPTNIFQKYDYRMQIAHKDILNTKR